MSLEGGTEADRRGEPRVAFDGAVRLRYRLFQKFLEENAANISTGGMFIRTIHPGEPGTRLDFEIRLDDDDPLIQGRGEVAWVRRGGERPGATPGMGIRFVELPEDSRALVEKIVAERVAAGLELFDLDRKEPAGGAADEPAAAASARSEDHPKRPPAAADPQMGDRVAAAGTRLAQAAAAGRAAAPPATPRASRPRSERDPGEASGAPLDPQAPPADASPAAHAAPAAPAAAGLPVERRGEAPPAPGSSRAGPLRLIAVAALSALIGAGAVLTFHWLYVQPSIEKLETRIDELAGRPGGPWQPPPGDSEPPAGVAGEAGGGAAGVEAANSAAAPEPAAADPVAEVTAALRGWAAAWSEQRVEDYLGYYAAGFQPPEGRSRAAWAEARRARIERPRWIRVALTLVRVEPQGPDAAVARFVQSYRAERYRDLVKKRLRMVREDGGWKIAEERVEG